VCRDAFGERTATTERLVHARVRGAVALGLAPADLDVEVGPDLRHETHVLAGESARRAGQRAQVCGDEVRPLLAEPTRMGHLTHVSPQPLGPAGQRGRVRRGLGGHLSAQCGIAGEGVDVALLDPVEAQPEFEVLPDQPVRLHDDHASCHTDPHDAGDRGQPLR
jgi:hypothetical protein